MSPILGIIASGANVAAGAFESIASATGTGSSGTITFSSISGSYQHLQLRILAKGSQALDNLNLTCRFNSDTGSNYSRHYIVANGVDAPYSYGAASQTSIELVSTSIGSNTPQNDNICGVGIVDIHDYASTSKYKTIRCTGGNNNNTENFTQMGITSGLWMSTSAITSISIITSGNFTTNTVIALYGIKGA